MVDFFSKIQTLKRSIANIVISFSKKVSLPMSRFLKMMIILVLLRLDLKIFVEFYLLSFSRKKFIYILLFFNILNNDLIYTFIRIKLITNTIFYANRRFFLNYTNKDNLKCSIFIQQPIEISKNLIVKSSGHSVLLNSKK